MKSIKNLLISTVLASLATVSGIAHSQQFAAIAVGPDNQGAPAIGKTQAIANWEAMKACNEEHPNKDCALRVSSGLVLVKVPESPGVSTGTYVRARGTIDEAKAEGLKACGKPECQVAEVHTAPGFWALARTKNSSGPHQYSLAEGYSDFFKAKQDAMSNCQKLSEFQCEMMWVDVVGGEMKSKAAPKK